MSWKPIITSYILRLEELMNGHGSGNNYKDVVATGSRQLTTSYRFQYIKKLCEQLLLTTEENEQYYLGFIQAILWLHSVYSVDELRMHTLAAKNHVEHEEDSSDALSDDIPF